MPVDVIMLPRKRPLSVWILCIANGAMAAVSIAVAILAEDRGYSSELAAYYGLFGLAISIAAHTTWFGYRWGRLALLTLLTVYFGMMIAYSAWAIALGFESDYVDVDIPAAWLRAVLSLAWLCANYVVLFGKKAKTFFG